MSDYHLILADDHPLFLQAMVNILQNVPVRLHIETATDYQQLYQLLQASADAVDLVLMDLHMPGCTALKGLEFLHQQFPTIPFLIFSGDDDVPMQQQVLQAGACAFVSKSSSATLLRDKVLQWLTGQASSVIPKLEPQPLLTPTQLKVLKLVACGFSNKQIAKQLGVAEKTIKIHVSALLTRLKLENRTQAALWFGEHQLQLDSTDF